MSQYDYTKGQLPDLIDVIIEEKAKLFVCAIGVPPRWAVDKLHKAGILVMNVSSQTTFLNKTAMRSVKVCTDVEFSSSDVGRTVDMSR